MTRRRRRLLQLRGYPGAWPASQIARLNACLQDRTGSLYMERRRSLAVRAFGVPFCVLISDGPFGRLQSSSARDVQSIISDRSMTSDCGTWDWSARRSSALSASAATETRRLAGSRNWEAPSSISQSPSLQSSGSSRRPGDLESPDPHRKRRHVGHWLVLHADGGGSSRSLRNSDLRDLVRKTVPDRHIAQIGHQRRRDIRACASLFELVHLCK